MSLVTTTTKVNLIDKEIFSVELADKEIFSIEFFTIDTLTGLRKNISQFNDVNILNPLDDQGLIYESGIWVNKSIIATVDPAKFVQGEIPTPFPPVSEGDKYTTLTDFQSGKLEVFLNGLKLLSSDITIYGNNQFSITIDTIITDVVTVNYIKP